MSILKKRLLSYTETQLNESAGTSHEDSLLTGARVIDNLAGRIETLQMTNFMCHSNLELNLNSRINFITGRNGSGKSAIMAALVVALGGSASATGRASGVADFIKKGETWAKVSVTLINEGINSFKKEVYGNRITIIRNLSTVSQNTYVCKSQTGAVVSRKKEEIDHIILTFNLQIKNPICILNQDLARTFLCSTDNSLRFALFAKATQLEHLKAIYMKTLDLLITAKSQLKIKEKGIEEASREINQIKEKLALFASLEKHVHERTKLENEYFWSLVVSEENKLNRLANEKSYLQERRKEFLEAHRNFTQIIKEIAEEVSEIQQKLDRKVACKSEQSGRRNEILRDIQAVGKEIEKVQTQFDHLVGKVERLSQDINGVKEHLAQTDTIVNQSQTEKKKNSEKIKKLREELSILKKKLSETETKYKEAQEAKYHHTKHLENLRADLGQWEQNSKRLEVLLIAAKTKNHNNLLKFGSFTPKLVTAIEEATMRNDFIKKPVGPCGKHVSLTGDSKWARAVESVIGGLMTTYCCDNQKDFETLTHIMEKNCGNNPPPIIISKFMGARHNVELRKVSLAGFQSILDVLTFDNDVVFNTFVDQARIETILLFETDSQAASVMSHVQKVPKNVRMGLTLQSDQYYPAPNYRTYYGDSKKPLKYFEGISKPVESMRKIENELKMAGMNAHERKMEIVEAKEGYRDACEVLKKFERKVKELKQDETRILLELKHLTDIEESRPVVIRKIALEEEVQNLQKIRDENMLKTSECKKILDSLQEKKNEFMKKLNALGMEESRVSKEISRLEEKMENKKFQMAELSGKKEGTNNQILKINQKLIEIDDEIKNSRACLATIISSAKDVCPERIETQRTPLEVQKQLEKCEKYLKAAEKITGSRQGTIAEYKTKMDLYNSMRKTEGVLANAIETLTVVVYKKEQRLSVLQSHTASLVSFYFQATLQTRGYDGQLKVDFENKVLDLEVMPKDAAVARKDSKTLSGGERSYSMVSFILAIWKVVQMPIYFLDEFDVFMDKVNRKVIMDLLIEHATVQTNKQFIFITPQDISSIEPSDSVSIFRLPDPERSYT